MVATHIYWLTKEKLQTFFANGSNRNIEFDICYTHISGLLQQSCLQAILLKRLEFNLILNRERYFVLFTCT